MIDGISWGGYSSTVIFFLGVYYLIVGMGYFKSGSFLKAPITTHTCQSGEEVKSGNLVKDEFHQKLFSIAQSLSDEIKAFYSGPLVNDYSKIQLLKSTQHILSKYYPLTGTEHVGFINNIIKECCQINCSITISEDDLKGIWQGGDGAY